MPDNYVVKEYETAAGKNKVKEFFEDLWKKRKTNELFIARRLISDLKDFGFNQNQPNVLKLLDGGRQIYEIKRKGKDVRLGLCAINEENRKGILLLGGFLKDSQKTRTKDLEVLRQRHADYFKRNK
jgi:inorganic pyrophosphatase/exopolyphosphatase